MSDIQNLVITPTGNTQVTVPTYTISVQIVDSDTGAVTHDFTGVNALQFPQSLGAMTNARRTALLRGMLKDLILKAAGVDN